MAYSTLQAFGAIGNYFSFSRSHLKLCFGLQAPLLDWVKLLVPMG
jgi:hypothetical protein